MRLLIFMGLMILICASSQSQAQRPFNYCDQAEHSGDIVRCLNDNYQKVAAELNTIYKNLERTQSPQNLKNFQNTQKQWIIYRDMECAWEANIGDNKSLDRIEELSCLISLTQNRMEVLSNFTGNTDYPNQVYDGFTRFPRWLNIMGQAHPDIYWRYDQNLTADLNCDGRAEEIMLGQTIRQDLNNNPAQQIETAVGIASNPLTGRPSSTALVFSGLDKNLNEASCNNTISMRIIERPDAESPGEACSRALEIYARDCATRQIYWDGETYIMDHPLKPQP